MRKGIEERGRGCWAAVRAAWLRFLAIDGGQRAAAFAYSAFFAIFPVILLTVATASFFMPREDAAGVVLSYIGNFFPSAGDAQEHIFQAVSRVVRARGQAGALALLMLVWASGQFFTTILQAANRAWGTGGGKWWKMPLKSLALLAVITLSVLVGVGLPMLAKLAAAMTHSTVLLPAAHRLALFFVPWLAVFASLTFFYKLAPHRRTRYSEVWPSALCATMLLYMAQALFVFYLRHFAGLNAVYGAFAGLMAVLLWIYVSGVIFVFCACLGAVQAEVRDRNA